MSSRDKAIDPRDPRALDKCVAAINEFSGFSLRGKGRDERERPSRRDVEKMIIGFGKYGGRSSGRDSSTGADSSPAPSGVSVSLVRGGVLISWSFPLNESHRHTEVWRATTDSLTEATRIGISGGSQFIDMAVDPATDYYYFLRHAGDSSGPFSSSTAIKSAADPFPFYQSGVLVGSDIDMTIDTTSWENGGRVEVELTGVFQSYTEWDATNSVLKAETGDAVYVQLLRDGSVVASATPTQHQTSNTGPNGEKRYIHQLNALLTDTPPEGSNIYTLRTVRIYPANSDSYSVQYKVSGG